MHFRGDVTLHPEDALARLRLGSTLLFALGRTTDAMTELEEATRLEPELAEARTLLALAQVASGRAKDAASGFEEALRIDEHLLEHRPAMQAAFDAARRGEAWP